MVLSSTTNIVFHIILKNSIFHFIQSDKFIVDNTNKGVKGLKIYLINQVFCLINNDLVI